MSDSISSDSLLTVLRREAMKFMKQPGRPVVTSPELLALVECAEALQMVRDYVVTMKGKGHEYQVAVDSALAKLESLK